MGLEKQLEKLTHAVDIMTQDFDMLVRSFSEFNEQLMLQKKTFLNDVAISAEDILTKPQNNTSNLLRLYQTLTNDF